MFTPVLSDKKVTQLPMKYGITTSKILNDQKDKLLISGV